LFLLGMAMVLENWILLAIVAVLVPVQIARAKKEEQVLREAFGEEYVRYKAGTWF
jgi:protein-S-isoprenylcysteine O-methyltransferase Ste14